MMKRPLRLAYFAVIVFLFFVISPILLFYIAGYRYNFDDGTVESTGIMYLRTFPKRASVYLDGVLQDQVTNTSLEGLSSGVYDISITREDYRDWKKSLTIEDGLVTRTDFVYLFPKVLEFDQLFSDTVAYAEISSDGKHSGVIRTLSDNSTDLLVFSLTDRSPAQHLFSSHSFQEALELSYVPTFTQLLWSPDDQKFLIQYIDINNKEFLHYASYDLEDTSSLTALPVLDDIVMYNIQWKPSSSDRLFFQTKDSSLSVYNLVSQEVVSLFDFDDITSFSLFEDIGYLYRSSTDLVYSFSVHSDGTVGRFKPFISTSVELQAPIDRSLFQLSSHGNMVVISANGDLYLHRKNGSASTLERIATDVHEMTWQGDSEKLAYITSHELWVYYVVEQETYHSVKEDTKELVLRTSKPLVFLSWFAEYPYLFYSTDTELFATELDGRDVLNTVSLRTFSSSEHNPSFMFNPEAEELFLWDDYLYRLRLPLD